MSICMVKIITCWDLHLTQKKVWQSKFILWSNDVDISILFTSRVAMLKPLLAATMYPDPNLYCHDAVKTCLSIHSCCSLAALTACYATWMSFSQEWQMRPKKAVAINFTTKLTSDRRITAVASDKWLHLTDANLAINENTKRNVVQISQVKVQKHKVQNADAIAVAVAKKNDHEMQNRQKQCINFCQLTHTDTHTSRQCRKSRWFVSMGMVWHDVHLHTCRII